MATTDEQYTHTIRAAEEKLLHFLRTFEAIQENIHFGRIAESQAELQDVVGDLFTALPGELSQLSPPEPLQEFHSTFSAAVARCADASAAFLRKDGQDFSLAFLTSRGALCRGLNLLYGIREQLPILQQYWVFPETRLSLARLDASPPNGEVPVGMMHEKRTDAHADYSLYVPEQYTPEKTWPLIICLHGGYGRGDDYIWTWLRPAKSKGYLLLSPKSIDVTWSVLRPPIDVRSITTMFEEVCATYAVDRRRVYLTGLSDGGIFTYILGLTCPELFAGIAPIAGDLHPMTDAMLRRGQGKDVPIYIVHGVHDFIFPVASVRDAHRLLTHIGYNATYKELPDWGHAYTYTINEQLVLPWFESLEPKPEA